MSDLITITIPRAEAERMLDHNIGLREAQIVAAQQAKVDDIDKFLASRKFNRSQISGIKAAYKTDEGNELVNECSVWDAVVAATAYARNLQYQDARIDVETAAGKMLRLAA